MADSAGSILMKSLAGTKFGLVGYVIFVSVVLFIVGTIGNEFVNAIAAEDLQEFCEPYF